MCSSPPKNVELSQYSYVDEKMARIMFLMKLLFLIFEFTFCYEYLTSPLRNFVCPNLNSTCPGVTAISKLLYPQDLGKWNIPTFPHLDRILSTFQNQHCFTMITLFQNVDIQSSFQPILVRHPEAAVNWMYYKEPYNQWFVNSLFWAFPDVFACTNTPGKCNQSKFWNQYDTLKYTFSQNFQDSNILLSFHNFSLQTKPWNCQLSMGLYVPTFEYDGHEHSLNFPKIFAYPLQRLEQYHNIVPSAIPKVHINVFQKPVSEVGRYVLRGWMETTSRDKWNKLLINDVFIVINGHEVGFAEFKMFAIQSCTECEDVSQIEFTELDNSLSILPQGKAETGRSWDIRVDGRNKFLESIGNNLLECEGLKPTSHKLIFSYDIRLLQVAYAYATVWTSIMGNYTYDIYQDFEYSHSRCVNGRMENRIPSWQFGPRKDIFIITLEGMRHFQYNTGGYLYPVDLPNLVDRLKFVSCGERGFTDLAYGELLRVFDYNVWIFLIISVIGVASSLSGLISGTLEDFAISLLMGSKALIEQGNPFSRRFLQIKKLRIILGFYFIVSVVISSAYKNRNIYRMIRARETLKYDKFSELVNANFSIYARTSVIRPGFFHQEYYRSVVPKYDFIESHRISMKPSGVFMYVRIYSEIFNLGSLIANQHSDNINTSPGSEDGNVDLSELQRGTQLHPMLPFSVISNAVSNISDRFRRNHSYAHHHEMELKMRQILREGEMRLLNDSLRMCNRTAVILPESSCLEFASELRAEGYQHVFVGKEVYASGIAIAFSLTGLVPRYIIKKIQSIQHAGIWERWATYAKANDMPDSTGNAPQGASLHGNIFIVFFLFLCGGILSVVVFVTEVSYIKLIAVESRTLILSLLL